MSDKINRIERYLAKDMSKAEQLAFEEDLSSDMELAAEVKIHQMLQDEFGDVEKQNLLKAIGDAERRHRTTEPPQGNQANRWIKGIFLLVALLGVGWFLWPSQADFPGDEPEPGMEIKVETVDESPESPSPEQGRESDEVRQPQTNPKTPSASQPLPPPIASLDPTDFTPHPYLDQQIGQASRADSRYDITAKANRTQLEIKGQLEGIEVDQSWVLMVYSNQGEDYVNGDFLLREIIALEVQEEGETFSFSFRQTVNWTPGLYYYFLAYESDEEPKYVGKLRVE